MSGTVCRRSALPFAAGSGLAVVLAMALRCTTAASPPLSGTGGGAAVGGGGASAAGSAGTGGAAGTGAGGSAAAGTGGSAAAGAGGSGGANTGGSIGAGGSAAAGTGGSAGGAGGAGGARAFAHPGLLHSDDDFARMQAKVAAGAQPWLSGWQRLTANAHAQLTWTARPAAMIYRGADGTNPENYAQLFNDAAAAYALALRWKISGDSRYADTAVQILNAWSAVLVGIGGTSDKFLAAGLYGYQMANAAEIMRTYSGWSAADFARFKTMMTTVFYAMTHDFLTRHNAACISHYWANWDLCNMDSVLAIGVLTDDRAIYDEAVAYFETGAGNGAIGNAVFYVHPGNLGQ